MSFFTEASQQYSKEPQVSKGYTRDFMSMANTWPEPELPNGYNVFFH